MSYAHDVYQNCCSKDGTWAASPELLGERKYIPSPCPAGYCDCSGLSEESLSNSGCALRFGVDESICVGDRSGMYSSHLAHRLIMH